MLFKCSLRKELANANPRLTPSGALLPALPSPPLLLQAFEPNYRWDANYRLNQDPLTKNSAESVSSWGFTR